MSFKEEIKNMSNKELIYRIKGFGCNSYYREIWNVVMDEIERRLGVKAKKDEIERRLGVKAKKIEEAIGYFKYGISHDIFSEEMIKIAEISIEALERMRDDIR